MLAQQTVKREAYCFAVARGLNGTNAAIEAGYASPSVRSSKLLKIAAVRGRIAEIRSQLDQHKYEARSSFIAPTREWVMSELCENVGKAKEANDRGAVNKGLELVGRELGMFVQRTMAIESPLQRLPADKLIQLLALIEQVTGSEQIAKPMVEVNIQGNTEPTTIEGELVSDEPSNG